MADVGPSHVAGEDGSKRSRPEDSSELVVGCSAAATPGKKAKIDALWQQLNTTSRAGQQRGSSSNMGLSLQAKLESDPRASSLGGLSMIIAGLEKQQKSRRLLASSSRQEADSSLKSLMSGLQAKQARTSAAGVSNAVLAAGKLLKPAPAVDLPLPTARPGAKAAASPTAATAAKSAPLVGLDAALAGLQHKKTTVLGNTRQDWKQFKAADADINEELETYKKSNDKYLDKVHFLKRAELKEYELERDERAARRPARSEAPVSP